jgi:uncharacterized protein involved in type VI secretion and phage assembly
MPVTLTHSVVIGLVEDVDDPERLGRIRVSYPWLDATTLSDWVPIAYPMAGRDRGFFYLPELQDEAVVIFDHGHFDQPRVIGFLHNGEDTPPNGGIDKHVRRIKSVSGHIVDLDDRDGAEKVSVKSQGGHSLELRDGDGTIEIATAGGQTITMADSPAQIELTTVGRTTITVSDLPSQVEVQTAGGVTLTVADTGVTVTSMAPVQVQAPTVDVTAAAAVSLTAPTVMVSTPLANFTGILECATLIAQSVISATYTPGIGNIW